MGEASREAGRRPHRRRRSPHPNLEPRTNNVLQKKSDFFSIFFARQRPRTGPEAPRTAPRGGSTNQRGATLIAQ